MHIVAGGDIFPVEFKHSSKGPSLNHKYQLIAYAMLLEDAYNRPVRYGFVYINTGKIIPVEVTPNARVYVKEMLDKIRLLDSQRMDAEKSRLEKQVY